ncbi:MAG TPA: acylglycerol kinase family protein, partial [Solirubrobacteraceae bacterium]
MLIVNPNAGAKRSLVRLFDAAVNPLDEVTAALTTAGVRFELRPTQAPGHATELAREAAQEGRQLVIVAGGDGTANEAAQGVAHSETTLGLMPVG